MHYATVEIIRHPIRAEKLRGRVRAHGPLYKAVCSDRAELERWARERGISTAWIHASRSGVWHIDLWGAGIKLAGVEGLA